MLLMLLAYTLLLAFSFQITTQTRIANPPTLLIPDEEWAEFALLAQEATISDVRNAVFRNLLILVILGGLSTYWLAGRLLAPLRQITAAANRVSAGNLELRLEPPAAADELRSLAQAFNQMLDRLERSFAQQERFVADAAHELRTPLASLRSTLETLPPAALSSTEQQELRTTCMRQIDRLEGLVAGLLLLATSERQLEREEVMPAILLDEICAELHLLADAHDVSLSYGGDSEAMVCGDADLLSLALRNLIENGIRYNHPQGRVHVDISQSSGLIALHVRDSGIGISTEEQPHIFERFYRVEQSRARHLGGAGLGLPLVKHIVQRHGGIVSLESNPDQGSTFSLWLPAPEAT
jgi:signal transduction histidine kinase